MFLTPHLLGPGALPQPSGAALWAGRTRGVVAPTNLAGQFTAPEDREHQQRVRNRLSAGAREIRTAGPPNA